MFRCDPTNEDPGELRAKLSEYGNRMFEDIWLTKGCPQDIVIAEQPLKCNGRLQEDRYGHHKSCFFKSRIMRIPGTLMSFLKGARA